MTKTYENVRVNVEYDCTLEELSYMLRKINKKQTYFGEWNFKSVILKEIDDYDIGNGHYPSLVTYSEMQQFRQLNQRILWINPAKVAFLIREIILGDDGKLEADIDVLPHTRLADLIHSNGATFKVRYIRFMGPFGIDQMHFITIDAFKKEQLEFEEDVDNSTPTQDVVFNPFIPRYPLNSSGIIQQILNVDNPRFKNAVTSVQDKMSLNPNDDIKEIMEKVTETLYSKWTLPRYVYYLKHQLLYRGYYKSFGITQRKCLSIVRTLSMSDYGAMPPKSDILAAENYCAQMIESSFNTLRLLAYLTLCSTDLPLCKFGPDGEEFHCSNYQYLAYLSFMYQTYIVNNEDNHCKSDTVDRRYPNLPPLENDPKVEDQEYLIKWRKDVILQLCDELKFTSRQLYQYANFNIYRICNGLDPEDDILEVARRIAGLPSKFG